VLAIAGATAGGTYLLRRRLRRRSLFRASQRLAAAVASALPAADTAPGDSIQVVALGPGLVELSGRVSDQRAAERATEVAQRVPGVHTVVNRLSVEGVERQRAAARRRYYTDDPALRSGGWEGGHSGMGARRFDTDSGSVRGPDATRLIEAAESGP